MLSVDLGMVLHGRHDPAVEAVAGPLCQHAAEWWRATDAETPPGGCTRPWPIRLWPIRLRPKQNSKIFVFDWGQNPPPPPPHPPVFRGGQTQFMQGWGPEGWGPEGWGPERWGDQNFALFFSLSRRKIRSFSLSLGVFSLNLGGV